VRGSGDERPLALQAVSAGHVARAWLPSNRARVNAPRQSAQAGLC